MIPEESKSVSEKARQAYESPYRDELERKCEGGALRVWIDTAFNEGLVILRRSIEQFGLKQRSTTAATFADGRAVDLGTFTGYLDWFQGNPADAGRREQWSVSTPWDPCCSRRGSSRSKTRRRL
jgi:hypothetical protein